MGIKERHERDREAVRRAILDAARELFVTDGYPNVSIRKIAERIEYSPASIYGYFPSKDDIFFELAEEGFRLLASANDVDRLSELPPLDRLRAIYWRLYEFSRMQPEYFALMFVERSVPRITREYERFRFVGEMRARLAQRVQECIDAGTLPPSTEPHSALRLLMMAIVGVATMRLSERVGADADCDAVARDMLDTLIAGLQSGVVLRSSACECTAESKPASDVSAAAPVAADDLQAGLEAQ